VSSTCFETDGSSSGRWFSIQVWNGRVCITCIGLSSLVGGRVGSVLLARLPNLEQRCQIILLVLLTCRRRQSPSPKYCSRQQRQ